MNKSLLIKSNLYDYTVDFVSDFSQQLGNFMGNLTYVIDRNIYEIYKTKFAGITVENIFFIEAIESKKSIDTILSLIEFWKSRGLQKDYKVICFGGGITQDITTFAANIYLRNIDWYFFPTTLLAMCDSCIGGKCGINFHQYKNQLGVFYPPKKIFIDVSFIDTLSREDYINGWGEILKFSLTNSSNFYSEINSEKNYIPCSNISEYIYQSLLVKKNIIEQDEFEGDLRRVLNYGHTFGHALESYTLNAIAHGTAVIWGIDVVNYIAYREGILDKKIYMDVKNLIKKAFIPCEIKISDGDELIKIVATDKKVRNNVLSLVIMDKLSHLIIYPMEIGGNINGLFRDYLEETNEYYSN